MDIAACLSNYPSGMVSFWLLIPKWVRRLTRHCEDRGGTNFLLDRTPSAPPWTSADRTRRIELVIA